HLWFTNEGSSTIGRITAAGVVSIFPAPSINSPRGITAGPDGNLWFTNSGNGSIGRTTPYGDVSNVAGAGIANPAGIVTGPDGA
ncbi:virginiamycin B lyase family protein, partial [Vibrio parahaemolyticus]|uniref:virginiamycin B lyase family protein n=1 Tax=Vibrio parahaemolyticus TaxID=670 RepID=UPI003F6667F5|nr:hypothetical protein [Vibrio parahaemolyticus]